MKKMTDAELKEKLGDYIAPQGLYQITKDMPFLGKVSCNIERMEAGSWQEIIIDYVHADAPKFAALLGNTFFCCIVGAICLFALLKISFGV